VQTCSCFILLLSNRISTSIIDNSSIKIKVCCCFNVLMKLIYWSETNQTFVVEKRRLETLQFLVTFLLATTAAEGSFLEAVGDNNV
jgi:hypothetical protein